MDILNLKKYPKLHGNMINEIKVMNFISIDNVKLRGEPSESLLNILLCNIFIEFCQDNATTL